MGAEPWDYFTPYKPDINEVLQELRKQEFEAGRYYGGYDDGPCHDSIEEAMQAADSDGTCSILDIVMASEVPDNELEPDCAITYPLKPERLIELFGTDKPTRKLIEENQSAVDCIFDEIDRGSSRYIIVYEDGRPSEVLFLGYSYD
ncbi:MAG: hypothetical protein K2Z81_17720 [Cyanobacteria bacterium]|nr:hypothetical protein [Cyanobacteriota bacterium]